MRPAKQSGLRASLAIQRRGNNTTPAVRFAVTLRLLVNSETTPLLAINRNYWIARQSANAYNDPEGHNVLLLEEAAVKLK
jgi:hypothetical protein